MSTDTGYCCINTMILHWNRNSIYQDEWAHMWCSKGKPWCSEEDKLQSLTGIMNVTLASSSRSEELRGTSSHQWRQSGEEVDDHSLWSVTNFALNLLQSPLYHKSYCSCLQTLLFLTFFFGLVYRNVMLHWTTIFRWMSWTLLLTENWDVTA